MTFRNALDAEMREANKLGVAQERKMAERKEIAEEIGRASCRERV